MVCKILEGATTSTHRVLLHTYEPKVAASMSSTFTSSRPKYFILVWQPPDLLRLTWEQATVPSAPATEEEEEDADEDEEAAVAAEEKVAVE